MPPCLTAIGLVAATALLAGCAGGYNVNLDELRQRPAVSAYDDPPPRAAQRVSTRTRSNPKAGDQSRDVAGGDVAGSVGQASPRRDTPEGVEAADNDRINRAVTSICRGC
jgi:hypothetical protein